VPPDRRKAATFKSLPIQSFAGWDTVADILATLQQYENGAFSSAARLLDNMGRDDRIDGVLRTRVDSLLQAPLDITPADDRRKAQQAAEMLGGVDDGPGEWDRMFPDGCSANLLYSGLGLNMAVAEIIWTTDPVTGIWWPRLKFWHSQFVRWDFQTERYRLLTANNGEIELPDIDRNPVGNGQWFMWCPFGYQYAWLRGMIRSLAPMYMRRMWINRDWNRYNEIHGLGLRKAIVPIGGDDEKNDAFFEDVANMHGEPVVMAPQGEEGNKYDVHLLEAVAKTYETFEDSKTDVNADIAVLILGQPDTTEAQTGGLSTGAQVGPRAVKLEKAKRDAMFATAIYHQVLIPWAQINHLDPSLAPRPVFKVEPDEDGAQKAGVLKALGDGIAALQLAKVPIDVRTTAEEYGIHMISEEEQAAQEAVAAEEAAAAAAQFTQQADNDNDNDNDNDEEEKEEEQVALAAKVRRRQFVAGDVVERYEFAGLSIAVEHAAGTKRVLDGGNGVQMANDYGFIEGHLGSDGDELDVYIGPNESAADVFVVHQLKAPSFTAMDEDKVFLGFESEADARTSYLAHRGADGERAIKSIDTIPVDTFKAKLQRRRGGGMIKARGGVDPTVAKIMALADMGVAALRAGGGSKKKPYADRLTAEAMKLGARALAVDLRGVKSEIRDATSFEDMEKRLVAYYRDKMDPDKLARLIQRTRLMGNLTGRLAVAKGA
jgi:phage gp29-like protein